MQKLAQRVSMHCTKCGLRLWSLTKYQREIQYQREIESSMMKNLQTAIPGTPLAFADAAIRHVTKQQMSKKSGGGSCIIRKTSSQSTEVTIGDDLISAAEKIVLSYPDYLTAAIAEAQRVELMASARSSLFLRTSDCLGNSRPDNADWDPPSKIEPVAPDICCCLFCCLLRCFVRGDFNFDNNAIVAQI